MKRTLILVAIFIASLTLMSIGQPARAITIVIGPNAQEIKDRYQGSIVVYDDRITAQYWYVDPATQTKYALVDGKSVSRLLKSLGEGISNTNLSTIPTEKGTEANYELVHNMKGKFLIQVEENGEAWYLNPIDGLRYQIANGKKGFKTLKKIALDISKVKLNAIPTTKLGDFQKNVSTDFDMEIYWAGQMILKQNYYRPGEISDLDMFYGSLRGIADSLNDPYTEFFTPKDKINFDDSIDGEIEGIGAMVDIKNGRFTIITPLDNTPAQRAGLEPNDQVLFVDDTDINGFDLETSIKLIKGPKGTSVKLTIFRPSSATKFEVTIVRDRIEIESASAKRLANNIAYFKFSTFATDLRAEFDNLRANVIDDSTRGVIIDLRNNPGGFTGPAINIADYWLEPGAAILSENFHSRTVNYSARLEKIIDLPTVILVNSGSASSSEIFAAALAENGEATLVGQQTFGKGTGQTMSTFADGSALKYTIFEWLTPKGNSVQDNGLIPEFIVENKPNFDTQLQKAINLLQ